ncbi:hypothetical protein SEA_MARKY_2 [Streptomyces phage Marky]|nr:hypothetical protein SEA_MARKY_2 [Streptomyces phage Marky]
MADAKNTDGYKQGGEDDGWDTVGDNPTGRARKSSRRSRAKKARRLFGGTPWSRKDEDPKK